MLDKTPLVCYTISYFLHKGYKLQHKPNFNLPDNYTLIDRPLRTQIVRALVDAGIELERITAHRLHPGFYTLEFAKWHVYQDDAYTGLWSTLNKLFKESMGVSFYVLDSYLRGNSMTHKLLIATIEPQSFDGLNQFFVDLATWANCLLLLSGVEGGDVVPDAALSKIIVYDIDTLYTLNHVSLYDNLKWKFSIPGVDGKQAAVLLTDDTYVFVYAPKPLPLEPVSYVTNQRLANREQVATIEYNGELVNLEGIFGPIYPKSYPNKAVYIGINHSQNLAPLFLKGDDIVTFTSAIVNAHQHPTTYELFWDGNYLAMKVKVNVTYFRHPITIDVRPTFDNGQPSATLSIVMPTTIVTSSQLHHFINAMQYVDSMVSYFKSFVKSCLLDSSLRADNFL